MNTETVNFRPHGTRKVLSQKRNLGNGNLGPTEVERNLPLDMISLTINIGDKYVSKIYWIQIKRE